MTRGYIAESNRTIMKLTEISRRKLIIYRYPIFLRAVTLLHIYRKISVEMVEANRPTVFHKLYV